MRDGLYAVAFALVTAGIAVRYVHAGEPIMFVAACLGSALTSFYAVTAIRGGK